MIFQRKYSIYFYASIILVTLYGSFSLYVLLEFPWDQLLRAENEVAAALGSRIIGARILGIVLIFGGLAASLFFPKIFGRYLLIAAIWSWISFIDDTITFQGGVVEISGVGGGLIVGLRPIYVLLVTYIVIEHWARYGGNFD